MQLTHLGHACLLIETDGARILVDPGVFSRGFEELTDLDAIVITHQHTDHVDVERLPVLLEANDGAQLLVEPETSADLHAAGIDATALHPGAEVEVAGVPVRAIGGQHAVIHPDIPRVGNVGVLIGTAISDGGSGLLLHPGDAYSETPSVDVLALPLWAPWSKVGEMVDFLRAVAPRIAVPIHESQLLPAGRAMYLGHATRLAPESTELHDLAGAGAVELL
jgi:L-ascorbate metabolism protein UlaG (beta-lactamase superfamily)